MNNLEAIELLRGRIDALTEQLEEAETRKVHTRSKFALDHRNMRIERLKNKIESLNESLKHLSNA